MPRRPSVLLLVSLAACSGSEGATVAECKDLLDNDGDGVLDCAEEACAGLSVCGALVDTGGWGAEWLGGDTDGTGGVADSGAADETGASDGGVVDEATPPDGAALVVNEFMASNDATYANPDDPSSFPDWIELFNGSNADVDLTGYTLSDDPADPGASPLAGVTVRAGGYVVLLADGDTDAGPLHVAFKLKADGGSLGLYDPDGDALTVLDYTGQSADVSAARVGDAGSSWALDATPTPGASNSP